jgi:glycosidase
VPTSVFDPQIQTLFDSLNTPQQRSVTVDGTPTKIFVPFASPTDWRDAWIYFLLVDRFNNPSAPPKSTTAVPSVAFDQPFGEFQGGTFDGIRQKLGYLRDLGVGAIWLSPVLKNCQYDPGTFHGYGIQDFLHAEPRFSSNPVAALANPTIADDELRALVDEIHARGMYVIFDIILNHTGNVFGYVTPSNQNAAKVPFQNSKYDVRWHDAAGNPAFPDIATAPQPLAPDAGVWPVQLQANERFRRQGVAADAIGAFGDFESLRQMVSEDPVVQNTLIRAYQYAIARFDCDGFRIDTFKVPNIVFGHTFCAAMREFALSIGKENFFTFGEITVGEADLRDFIGRDTWAGNTDTIGIDAALDFPLFGTLDSVVKHFNASAPPSNLAAMYLARKIDERTVITTHGEASAFFVTFLDNHDQKQRFYFVDPANPHRWDNQLTLALASLFGLQGIPCVYYGTEQGLHGIGGEDKNVREALWGKPSPFDQTHPFYKTLQAIAQVRASQPALRYGRQYFRQLSGDRTNFSISTTTPGVIAFSRILNTQEVLVVANTAEQPQAPLEVIVDANLNASASPFKLLYSNVAVPRPPGTLRSATRGTVAITELDGSVTNGPALVLPVTLQSLEVQILRP